MSFRVKIDATACIGSGSCIAAAPTSFRRDEEGVRAFPTSDVAGLGDDVLLDVARNCPSGAIYLFDTEGEMVEVFGS